VQKKGRQTKPETRREKKPSKKVPPFEAQRNDKKAWREKINKNRNHEPGKNVPKDRKKPGR